MFNFIHPTSVVLLNENVDFFSQWLNEAQIEGTISLFS